MTKLCSVFNLDFKSGLNALLYIVFCGHSERDTPVPISNTVVKSLSADGIALETEWESRTPQTFSF